MCRSVFIYLVILTITSVRGDVCSLIRYSATKWDANCADRNLSVLPDYSNRPIVYLNLRNNSLSSNVTFKGWKSLIYVDLSYNKLFDVHNSTFEGFEELESVNVSYCSLKSISSSHLKGKTMVKLLDLSGNHDLPASKDFPEVLNKSLERGTAFLLIADMKLANLPRDAFSSAKSLRRLHLDNNCLTELPVFPVRLHFLDISNNSLTALTPDPFKFCVDLKILKVENNVELVDVEEEAFRNLSNLTSLSLKGSKKLSSLPNGVFYHNRHLTELSLAGCNFKTLSPYFKPLFMDLRSIELFDNPWECNPSIRWFLTLKSTQVKQITCGGNVKFDEYYGAMKQTVIKHVIIVMVAMTFLFFILGGWYAYDLEKRRRSARPYWPLGNNSQMSSPVYISTVV